MLKISFALQASWDSHYDDDDDDGGGSDEYEDGWIWEPQISPAAGQWPPPPFSSQRGAWLRSPHLPQTPASFTPQCHLKSWSPVCILTNYCKCEPSRPINKRFVRLCKVCGLSRSCTLSAKPQSLPCHTRWKALETPNLAALQLARNRLQTAPAVCRGPRHRCDGGRGWNEAFQGEGGALSVQHSSNQPVNRLIWHQ